jgi:HD-GYP domain-containing protein (c-di-GMP phosphodiesterase class II)
VDRRTLVTLAFLAAAGLLAVFAWPLAVESPAGPIGTVASIAIAVVATLLALVIVTIAWQAREWGPAMLATGCLSMGLPLASRALLAEPGLGLAGDTGPLDLPLLGCILGGFGFGLSAFAWAPTTPARANAVRAFLVAAATVLIVVSMALPFAPSFWPSPTLIKLLAALSMAGYAWAALAFFGTYRLLRLPSQFCIAAGSALFALTIPFVLGGGIPGMPSWEFEFLLLLVAVLPPLGFLAEHRARPGLRTMVLSLFLPGAIANIRRGYPDPMLNLVEEIARVDEPLHGHVSRVATLAVRIGMRLRLNASHLRELAFAAQLHDIGKIAIPRAILEKEGPLTPGEFAIIQTHAAIGEEIVRRCTGISSSARAVGEHHERWDGAGYPLGRAGSEISITGRIVAVADVFDALASKRSYKDAWDPADALAEIQRAAGTHFDPRIVEELARVLELQAQSREAGPRAA